MPLGGFQTDTLHLLDGIDIAAGYYLLQLLHRERGQNDPGRIGPTDTDTS